MSASVTTPLETRSGSEDARGTDDPLVEQFRFQAKECRELFLKHRAIAKEAYHAEGDRAEALKKEEKALDRKFAKLYSNLYDRIQALPKEDDRRAVMGGLWKRISE